MKKIFLPILVVSIALFTFSILPGYTEEYSYTNDAYDVLDAEDDSDVDKETNFLEKKAKVKKKKGKKGAKVSIVDPHAGHNIEPVVEQTEQVPVVEEQQAPPEPPPILPFPCDASVQCLIIDPILPPDVCQNQCQVGWFCQGRMDMRIGHFNIAVCVPMQTGSMGPSQ